MRLYYITNEVAQGSTRKQAWAATLKARSSVIHFLLLGPIFQQLYSLPRQHGQLGPKCSNTRATLKPHPVASISSAQDSSVLWGGSCMPPLSPRVKGMVPVHGAIER